MRIREWNQLQICFKLIKWKRVRFYKAFLFLFKYKMRKKIVHSYLIKIFHVFSQRECYCEVENLSQTLNESILWWYVRNHNVWYLLLVGVLHQWSICFLHHENSPLVWSFQSKTYYLFLQFDLSAEHFLTWDELNVGYTGYVKTYIFNQLS